MAKFKSPLLATGSWLAFDAVGVGSRAISWLSLSDCTPSNLGPTAVDLETFGQNTRRKIKIK